MKKLESFSAGELLEAVPDILYDPSSRLAVIKKLSEKSPPNQAAIITKISSSGAAAYQLGNTSSRTITEVKQR